MARAGNESRVADPDDEVDLDEDLDDEVDETDEVLTEDIDDDVDDLDRKVAPRPDAARYRQRQLSIAATVFIVAVGIVILAVLLLQPGKSTSAPKTPKQPTIGTFTDAADHIQISYPAGWKVQQTNEADVKLKVVSPTDDQELIQVRVIQTESPVDATNINDVKALTDAIISGANVKVLDQRGIQVGGLQGYDYFYTFPSGTPPVTLIHSHIFLFPPHEMVQIVFQTQDAQFAAFANDISFVLSTFHTI